MKLSTTLQNLNQKPRTQTPENQAKNRRVRPPVSTSFSEMTPIQTSEHSPKNLNTTPPIPSAEIRWIAPEHNSPHNTAEKRKRENEMTGFSKRPRKKSSAASEHELKTSAVPILGVAERVEQGRTHNKAGVQGLLNCSNPSLFDHSCRSCLRFRRAITLANQCFYEMTAQDRGWPRRAHHTSQRIRNLLQNTTKEYMPEKWFVRQGIKGVLVEEDKIEPWNSVYHPDVPQHGITIAISQTSDSVHITQYSPDMTFLELVLKLICQYPTHLGHPISPSNSLFVLHGRVIVCKRQETLRMHSIVDGTVIEFSPGMGDRDNVDVE